LVEYALPPGLSCDSRLESLTDGRALAFGKTLQADRVQERKVVIPYGGGVNAAERDAEHDVRTRKAKPV